jgi:uncharacterized protein YndB with AHSA1/START domain
MENKERTTITVKTFVHAPIDKVWKLWTLPEHITQWNNASADWRIRKVKNDLRKDGKFLYRMETKDGSMGFDFEGVYEDVKTNEFIEYSTADGRKVQIAFKNKDEETQVVETFEAEDANSIEMQRISWQSILDNFKYYVETNRCIKSDN